VKKCCRRLIRNFEENGPEPLIGSQPAGLVRSILDEKSHPTIIEKGKGREAQGEHGGVGQEREISAVLSAPSGTLTRLGLAQGSELDCSDFRFQEDAQAELERDRSAPNNLDAGNDRIGIVNYFIIFPLDVTGVILDAAVAWLGFTILLGRGVQQAEQPARMS
jgi:hypothetical protein